MTYALLFSIFKQFFLKKLKKSPTRKSINECAALNYQLGLHFLNKANVGVSIPSYVNSA